jgi:hypothetical protein
MNILVRKVDGIAKIFIRTHFYKMNSLGVSTYVWRIIMVLFKTVFLFRRVVDDCAEALPYNTGFGRLALVLARAFVRAQPRLEAKTSAAHTDTDMKKDFFVPEQHFASFS